MTTPKNMSASVRQRLLNRARTEGRPFNELLQYYAMERFLYRLSQSVHVDRFILKGALLLRIWRSSEQRPTRDIDMLGRTSNDEVSIAGQFQEILAADEEADGLTFDSGSIQAERITEAADYEGIRIRFLGSLGTARINMQVDIGFGDVVYPEPEELDLPTLLDFPAPRLLCYSRESSIAEKLEAIVKLDMLNSRIKDFYDIWLLSRQFDFNGAKLAEAIRLTFEQRSTAWPGEIAAFTDRFCDAKQTQWTAFRKRLQQGHAPVSFKEITDGLAIFLVPIIAHISLGEPKPSRWVAPGPWDASKRQVTA